jgi:hypothetical protein
MDVESVLENPPVVDAQTVQNSDPLPPNEKREEAPNQFPEGTAALEGMLEAGELKRASDVQAPKTIGKNRAQRLWTIMTQNKAKTGLTEEIVREKILKKLPKPLEHLSDLDFGMKDQFEKIMSGEIDWKTLEG